jgi:hypothetical protein
MRDLAEVLGRRLPAEGRDAPSCPCHPAGRLLVCDAQQGTRPPHQGACALPSWCSYLEGTRAGRHKPGLFCRIAVRSMRSAAVRRMWGLEASLLAKTCGAKAARPRAAGADEQARGCGRKWLFESATLLDSAARREVHDTCQQRLVEAAGPACVTTGRALVTQPQFLRGALAAVSSQLCQQLQGPTARESALPPLARVHSHRGVCPPATSSVRVLHLATSEC